MTGAGRFYEKTSARRHCKLDGSAEKNPIFVTLLHGGKGCRIRGVDRFSLLVVINRDSRRCTLPRVPTIPNRSSSRSAAPFQSGSQKKRPASRGAANRMCRQAGTVSSSVPAARRARVQIFGGVRQSELVAGAPVRRAAVVLVQRLGPLRVGHCRPVILVEAGRVADALRRHRQQEALALGIERALHGIASSLSPMPSRPPLDSTA